MRIAYGIMGYGRGHAMRSSAIIPQLEEQGHAVRVFAGPDAHAVMHERFDCSLIPTIAWRYGQDGRVDLSRTIRENVQPMADVLFGGAGIAQMHRDWDAFSPELVISDSEAWTHKVARQRRLPRISLDHVGIMAYCRPEFPLGDRVAAARDAWGYKTLMGLPEHAIVSSFYDAPARYRNVDVVGSILRDIVLRATPMRQGYLLAYFNKGPHQFLPNVEQALRALDIPVRVYGTGRVGDDDNLSFRAPSQQGFVDDLAGADAVLSTAGNQLISECIWLGKPTLLVPEDVVEQRLNAAMVVKMGIGEQTRLSTLTGYDIERFLLRVDEYAARVPEYQREGNKEAMAALARAMDRIRKRQAISLPGRLRLRRSPPTIA
ncbi:MAG: glycosyltransferase family protein [Oceanococcaceae bacterium]